MNENPCLPVLDLSPFRSDPTSPAAAGFLKELRDAAHGPGFAYIAGHGVDPRLQLKMIVATHDFFALPERQRREIENVKSAQFRGYTPVSSERTNGKPDRREQLDFGIERPSYDPEPGEPAYLRLLGPNQWPGSLPGFRAVVLRYMSVMQDLSLTMIRALAASLGAPADLFDATFAAEPAPHMKMIRYPAPGPDGNDQGVGAHKDYGFLALLLQDRTGGLQVATEDGFVDVPAIPNTFVFNVGEMFEIASGGYYRATVHRVVSPPELSSRVSVPYFFAPRLDARVPTIDLPPELAADVRPDFAPNPDNVIHAEYGENALRGWLRSHPDVARKHWSDLVSDHA
ncbi:MAG: oxidoreductase [Actinomycetia bacterium]|nr:oxidoreductase [Actinomycetes bacterium]